MSALDAFAAVSLADLDRRAELRRRVDRKYLVDGDVLERFLAAASDAFGVLEIDGRRRFAYRSLYFDTPDGETFRAHVQGRRRRFKCRRRTYVDTGRAAFEVKLKGERGETVKRRLPVEESAELALREEERLFLDETLLAAYGRRAPAGLAGTLEIRYARVTLVANAGAERVTCDFGLSATSPGRPVGFDAASVVVETKTATGAGAADRLLRRLGARPIRISKYVVATATAEERRANDFRRAIRRLSIPSQGGRT